MAGEKQKSGRRENGQSGNTGELIYLFDEKQFWSSYRQRKGYVITKQESLIEKQYEDMALFMSDILPLSYAEILKLPYRRFFRTLKIAQGEAKRKQEQIDKMKSNRRKK